MTRTVQIMIPGKATCPTSWTREYYGYLLTEWKGAEGRSTYICVDKDSSSVPDSADRVFGVHLLHVEPTCESLPCPPYEPLKEINCVVCTK